MCGHGELSLGGGSADVERGAGEVSAEVARGGWWLWSIGVTAALAQLLWPWRSLEDIEGRGDSLCPPPKPRAYVCPRGDKSVLGLWCAGAPCPALPALLLSPRKHPLHQKFAAQAHGCFSPLTQEISNCFWICVDFFKKKKKAQNLPSHPIQPWPGLLTPASHFPSCPVFGTAC